MILTLGAIGLLVFLTLRALDAFALWQKGQAVSSDGGRQCELNSQDEPRALPPPVASDSANGAAAQQTAPPLPAVPCRQVAAMETTMTMTAAGAAAGAAKATSSQSPLAGRGVFKQKSRDKNARRKKVRKPKTQRRSEHSSPMTSDNDLRNVLASESIAKEQKQKAPRRRSRGSRLDSEQNESKEAYRPAASESPMASIPIESSKVRKSESELKKEDDERLKKARGERFVIRVSLSDDVYEHMLDVASGPRGMSPNESVLRAERNRPGKAKKDKARKTN